MNFFFFKKTENKNYICKQLNYNFINILLKYNLNFFKKKKNFLNKSEKSIFTLKIFFDYLNSFFLSLKTSNSNSLNYLYFLEITSIFKNNIFFNNPIFFINWYFNFFHFIFFLKISKKEKIIKKDVSLLKQSKRHEYFFKLIKNIKFFKKNISFKNYYFYIMNDTYFNFKNSIVYKNKLLVYKKLINN